MNLSAALSCLSAGQLRGYFPQLDQKLDLKRHFQPVLKSLDQVEERLRFQAREFDPGITGYIEYATQSQGKRIRPALSLLMAHATGPVSPHHIDLAVVVELIHLATLVHDDIMDNASQRRGVPTAYAKWGAELSVLLGDCLFCQALKICATFPETDCSKKIADASSEVCSGEILQTQRRFDLKLSIPEYFKIIEMKTAALFRVSTELAAQLSNGGPAQVHAARVFGNSLGVAYQVYDDCLDLVGTEGSAEKTLGTDLARGKLTLPVLHVLQQLEGEEKAAFSEIILHGNETDRIKLLALVVERGGLKQAARRIQSYLAEATQALQLLPHSQYRDALAAMADGLSQHVARLAG
jgi:octaprenyl-diphosphate synthase